MSKAYNKPAFDKHADNLLQTIDKEWNRDVNQDELVLTFTVGVKRERAISHSLLQLLEVIPPPPPENTGGKSFLDPRRPCSYLDCSGIKFGASAASTDSSTFTSLVILKQYLEKVKHVKVLIFVPYNKLMMIEGESEDQNKWSSTIYSCPAIHLLNEMRHLKMSFGLVVVQQVESKPSGKNFQEIRNTFIEQIRTIRNNILKEDPSQELQLHLDFLKLVINKDTRLLILQQEQKYHWDGSVKSLINIKSPPGNKIIKFHQQQLRPTDNISGNTFLSISKKFHDGQHFTAISSRLYNQSIYKINQLIASTLSCVLEQYSLEAASLPKRKNHAVKLVEILDKATEFCKHRISSNSFTEFLELVNLLDYPLDSEVNEKLSTYFMQLTSITEVSNVLDIEIEQLKCQVNLKKECKIFHEKVGKKIFPKLAPDLQNERQEICMILHSAYQAISQRLIDFYQDQLLPKCMPQEKSRKNAIEMLCNAEELLEILEPETSSSLQITIYKSLCNWPGYKLIMIDFLGDSHHLEELEEQHKSVERTLQLIEHQYISCGNHTGSSISKKLRDHVNEVKCNMITCTELVQEIKTEFHSFFHQLFVTFEEKKICAGLDVESLPKKINKLNSLIRNLEERQLGNNFLTVGNLLAELDCISELLLNTNSDSESTKRKVEIGKGLGNLETFLDSIQQENLKTDMFNDLFTKSLHTNLLKRLTELRKLMTILIDMKESLSSYNCQSNHDAFLDNVSLNEGLLQSLIQTNFSNVYLSLAKEIAKHLQPVNTQVDQISDKVLQIKGNLVKFSDLVSSEKSLARRSFLKEIHVFATRRIFVDEDFCDDLHRELEITLISPSIEIIGSRVIFLNGKPSVNNFWYAANAGRRFGLDGEPGLPGKPGGNGGHFYMICEQLINAASLTVNVRGGNGGAGQNGGSGLCGKPGRDALASELSDEITLRLGDPGSSGGNGGDGGRGGYPGHGGSVEVVVLEKQDDSGVEVLAEDGKCGKDGKGGSGGTGGKYGNGIRRVKGWIWFVTEEKVITSYRSAPNGRRGRDGANSTNRVLPPSRKLKPDSKATVISELRKFYINQSNNGSGSVTRRKFLEKIDLKLEFQHVTVQTLAEELLQLELTSSRNLHGDPDSMLRDHEAFQKRLHRCVPLVFSQEQLAEDEDIKYVVKLLYAQSISKVLVLKEHQDGGPWGSTGAQVINILGYFDIIKDTINRLKESTLEINRRERLKTYHDHLKAKCEDTKDFISKIVLPSIAQAKRDIQEEINCCAGEVEFYERMVDEALKCRDNAARASEKIQFWDKIKMVLTVLEFAIGIAQWFDHSKLTVIALVGIAGIKRCIEMYDDKSPNSKQQQSIQLPACLNDFHGTMEDKMTRMRKEWKHVNKFVESHGDNHVLESKMIRIKPNLEVWQDQLKRCQLLVNLMKVKNIGEEFEKGIAAVAKNKTEVQNFFHEILEAKSLPSHVIDAIKHLLVSMAMANIDSSAGRKSNTIYHGPSSPPTEPIVIARGQLQSVQEKYAAIFRDIMPLMNVVFETVTPSSQKLGEKWRIQTTLKKLKQNLANFFNGLESKSNLIQAIQRMEEGLSVLIDLYDMIDNYEESKLFSEALTGIKLNSDRKEFVDLQETVDKIGYLLQANTFILEYNQAVKAFKQWVFPFANKCPIPSLSFETEDFVNCENSLEKLAAEYKSQFDTIHGHLLRYKSMKMDFDDVVFRGIFSSRSPACPPFYTWKCEEWGNTITRLLKGEEIELRADLMKAEELIKRKIGAVKFKTVQLKIQLNKNGIGSFGSRKQEEDELNKIMKLFKVTMVHSGISYYKVFDQCFVMRGSRNEYCYSFDGATKNSTYEKSESQGDYLLSPFTIWKFQLNEILEGGFEKLEKFVGQVDLELWGDGLYLDEGKAKEKKLDEKYLKDLHYQYELV